MKYLLSKLHLISVFAVLSSYLAIAPASAAQNPEHIQIHGSACQAITLSQAINRDARWTDEGMSNVNPLGAAGKDFFVVCPVVRTNDSQAYADDLNDIALNVHYSDHDGVNQLFCFSRQWVNGVVAKQILVTNIQTAGFTGSVRVDLGGVSIAGAGGGAAANMFDGAHTVVCHLYPGMTINNIVYDYD